MVLGNEIVVLPNGKQFEHAYLDKLDTTRRHESIERTTFHEHMDSNARTKNQNSADVQDSVEMNEGQMDGNAPSKNQNYANVQALVQLPEGQMDRNETT